MVKLKIFLKLMQQLAHELVSKLLPNKEQNDTYIMYLYAYTYMCVCVYTTYSHMYKHLCLLTYIWLTFFLSFKARDYIPYPYALGDSAVQLILANGLGEEMAYVSSWPKHSLLVKDHSLLWSWKRVLRWSQNMEVSSLGK